ncbi:MAG TPA: 50S ribosomal protein L18a [Candidatus Syntrophoarchaeum butanivorans]|nr:MAG: 50S ribosomal protein L18a [Candidatus Syntrophoarchaeum sp. WYZ-LMO15]HDM36089.1 50S ribosomal protein L18a [Candidatus Syntrophoarchaeum butanivorans]HEC57462.1 50S ribosomal protein L18a [Candidatus Syntrophoarchaeum butanivorans]
MPIFQVRGAFKVDHKDRRFTKIVESNSEKNAIEKVYSLLGSEHRLKRGKIRIEEVVILD